MLSEQMIYPSRGDYHWLGDGQYFFKHDFYAFRWIVIRYTNNFTNINTKKINNIYQHYMILKAELELESERIYSLCDPVKHINFMQLIELLEEKQEYSDRFKDKKIVDGVAINILFEDMNYNKDYDAIESNFPIKTQVEYRTRLNSFAEYQICIKNSDIIKKIVQFNDEIVPQNYLDTIDGYNTIKFGKTKTCSRAISNRYKITNKYKYKYK